MKYDLHIIMRSNRSDRPSDQSTQLGHLFHLNSRYRSRSKKLQLRPVQMEWENLFFLCWYHKKCFISPVIFLSWQFSGERPHTSRVFNILMFCLTSRRWFVLCLDFILHLGAGTCVRTSSIDWVLRNRFYLKTETESSLWNVVFWNINKTVF
jgi:hypothetical protein